MDVSLCDNAEDAVFLDKDVFDTVDFNGCAAVAGEKNTIALLDVERNGLAIFVLLAGADSDNDGFLGFFLGGIRDDDAPADLFVFFNAFQKNAFTEWFDFHSFYILLDGDFVGWKQKARTRVSAHAHLFV